MFHLLLYEYPCFIIFIGIQHVLRIILVSSMFYYIDVSSAKFINIQCFFKETGQIYRAIRPTIILQDNVTQLNSN